MSSAAPERVAHFRIMGMLGHGGMGVVYRAHDETLRRDVALKLLPESGDEERRQRFLREARSAAALTHPNVAVVHFVGEDAGRVFIAMELVEGENLRSRLDRGRIEVPEALRLAGQIASGLAAAHHKGLVHRDLKPENVMITPAGVVKLLDFGLAKTGVGSASGSSEVALANTETKVTSDAGRIIGTPEYMSPEQAMGEPLDVRSDVFSFGVVLYEMLAGVRPFTRPSTAAVLVAIARDAPPPLREHAPGVDEATEAIVMRCMAKSPAERFASAGEIVAALSGQTSPKATTRSRTDVEPVSRSGEPGKPGARGRVAAAGLGVAVLLAGGVAWRSMREAHPGAGSAPAASAAVASPDDLPSRSANAEAERLFEQAMRALHDDTGQAETLLEQAVAADPSFGGAYLRLWSVSRTKQVEHYGRLVAVESTLSRRDRELMQCLEDSGDGARARLDAFLARYPDEDVAWLQRINMDVDAEYGPPEIKAVLDRALAARPTLAPALGIESAVLWTAPTDERREVVARCLAISPHAVGCLASQLELDFGTGDCVSLEKHARHLLELTPDSFEARKSLACALVGQDASSAAVSDALRATPRDPMMSNGLLAEALLPMLFGDFPAAEAAARDHLAQLPGDATEQERIGGYLTQVYAYAESGDDEGAGRVAVDYLSRRKGWRGSNDYWVALMIGAAMRGHRLAAAEGDRMLRATYEARLTKMSAATAWTSVYALASWTPAEARAAVARMSELGISPTSDFESAPSFVANVLALAGQAAAARELLAVDQRRCGKELIASPLWLRSQLRLGELDEQAGDTASACSHYARVISRWGGAKPRSVTADEARAHAKKLRCPEQ